MAATTALCSNALCGRDIESTRAEELTVMTIAIHNAIEADSAQVLAAAVLAFCTDPFVRWVAADPHQYLTHYPALIKPFLAQALKSGTAYCSHGFSGVALWLPPEVSVDEQAVAAAIQILIPASLRGEAIAIQEQMASYHPTQPHWYLPLMGVEPRHQRQGLGSILLKHALVACDRDKRLAYLEASSRQNLALYERHGFDVIGTIQVGSSPPIFPMLREPR
jgi:ribosomal protein S18 acetylase RimI-like enzyme